MIQLDNSLIKLNVDIMDSCDNEVKCHKGVQDDVEEIVAFMKLHPEVEFCEWQNVETTRFLLGKNMLICYLARSQGVIVGVIIGGIMGTRGTVNHVAIDVNYRARGVGKQLSELYFSEIRRIGVKRVFLFVSMDNNIGKSFWSRQGFMQNSNEFTLEKDL